MCEIDITEFSSMMPNLGNFSGSVAERGANAGPETWRNAMAKAARKPLLNDPESLEALRQWAKDSGGWDKAEIAAWSDDECNALFIQIISGNMRELESLCSDDNGDINWTEAERLSSEGVIGGSLYPGDDGRIYYYLGS